MKRKGEFRVGSTFNPSQKTAADELKVVAADFINRVERIEPDAAHAMNPFLAAEVARLKALAQTAAEEAAMWAVKAATKKPE